MLSILTLRQRPQRLYTSRMEKRIAFLSRDWKHRKTQSLDLNQNTELLFPVQASESISMPLFSVSIKFTFSSKRLLKKKKRKKKRLFFSSYIHNVNYLSSANHHSRTVVLEHETDANSSCCVSSFIHHEKLAAIPRDVLTTQMSASASSNISASHPVLRY